MAHQSEEGWQRKKVTKVWDRFSASDMRHDIKLPSVARLSEKERVLLNSSAEPVTMRLELEPEPHLVLTVNGALAEDLGLTHWSPSLGNHQHRERDRKDREGQYGNRRD